MSIAVNVHHGLTDGMHISKYFETLQKLMNKGYYRFYYSLCK